MRSSVIRAVILPVRRGTMPARVIASLWASSPVEPLDFKEHLEDLDEKLECAYWSGGVKGPNPNTPILRLQLRGAFRMKVGGKSLFTGGSAAHCAAYCRRLAAEGAAGVIADVLDAKVSSRDAAAGGKA